MRRWSGHRHAVGRDAALRQRRDPRCRTLDGPTFFGGGGRDTGPDPAAALGAAGASADPHQAFEQLRAVLSSMDYADNSEQTVDFEDGTAEDGGQDDAAGTPGSPAVRAVYETLRIDQSGRTRRIYVRRRDLVRAHGLQPRDLRRVDPSLTPGRTPPSVTIKDDCVLINVGGVRAIITADRCLLFEPDSVNSRKLLETVAPRLHSSALRRMQRAAGRRPSDAEVTDAADAADEEAPSERIFPFELEMVEAALMVATGKLESELAAATRRVSRMLQKLPREITPVNLEELRRVKQLLVELESKAEGYRDLLEELVDDEDELLSLNLSSRPKREEKRRQRERKRLQRELELEGAQQGRTVAAQQAQQAGGRAAAAAAAANRADDPPPAGFPSSAALAPNKGQASMPPTPTPGRRSLSSAVSGLVDAGLLRPSLLPSAETAAAAAAAAADSKAERARIRSAAREEPAPPPASDALVEMIEEEEEERELEEVEDLLEYYLQRAATTQSEAERLLAGARDLEESIGVSLSARRFEVNRLELLLSIASFAAALGAMVASIFGMNLRSTLEMSVLGFWGTTALIVAGSAWVYWVLFKYTKRKRIL